MIGSHNTFTFRKPDKLWMYLLVPFVKCQSKGIFEQYVKNDVRLFDIRVRYDKKRSDWYICHGRVTYGPFRDTLLYMTSMQNLDKPIKIRLLIEGDLSNIGTLKKIFYRCYHDFEFYEGRHIKTGQQILNIPTLDIKQRTGSMQSWYGKICPWLYYILNKKKLRRDMMLMKESKNNMTIYDFI